MRLSVVIVNYKSRELLLECLASLQADAAGLETATLVVDNDSRDGSPEALAQRFPAVRVLVNPDNRGYARAVNQGIAATTGPWVLIMNPDCIVKPGTLRGLIGQLSGHSRCAIAAPRILNPDGSLEYSARASPDPFAFLFNRYSMLTRLFPRNRWSRRYLLLDWDHASVRDVDWVSGACLMARREAIEQVGGMAEGQNDVAALFRSTAEGETGHAHGHLEFLEQSGDPATGLPIGPTRQNLESAVAGETHEYTDMYPGMAKTARNEGFDEIADWFETLAKAERSHANRYAKALAELVD